MIINRLNRCLLPLLCAAAVLVLLLTAHGLFAPAAAQGDGCAGAPAVRLTINGRARVSVAEGNGLNLRDVASLAGNAIARLERGDELNVLAGPVCADGFYWWQLASDDGLTGWAAEGDATGYFLAPARVIAPTADPVDLTCDDVLPVIGEPGDQLVVTFAGQPVDALELPAVEAGFNSRWWAGSIFTIVSGPTCGNGLWWWRVTLPNNQAAWIPLGDSVQYYVALVTPTPTPSVTSTLTPLPTITATATPTTSDTPTHTPPPSDTPAPTASPTATPSPPPADTATPSPPPADTATPTVTLTQRPTSTRRPTLVPTPTLDTICWTAPLPRLQAGAVGEVAPTVDALRLRLLPSTGAGYEVLLNAGTRFRVLEGPTCNGGYYWYRVRLGVNDETGWVAEGLTGQYWIQPVDDIALTDDDRLCLAWGDDDGLHVHSRGAITDLAASQTGAATTGAATALRLSPNGRLLAAVMRYPNYPNATPAVGLEVYDLTTGQRLFAMPGDDFDPSTSAPVGDLIWLADSSGLIVNGTVRRNAARVTAIWRVSLYGQATRLDADDWQAAALSPDGARLVLVRNRGWEAAVFDLATGTLGPIIAPEAAPEAAGDAAGDAADGDPAIPTTTVSWRSGTALVVDFYRGEGANRYLVQSAQVDVTSGDTSFTVLPVPLADVTWAPDGSLVAYTMPGGGFWLAENLSRPGALLLPLSEDDIAGFLFMWSPAGGALIYRSPQTPDMAVVALEIEGGVARTLGPPEDGVWTYTWLDDASLLAVSDNASAALVNQAVDESFWRIDLDSGAITPLVTLDRTFLGAYDASAAGCLAPPDGP